MEAVKSICLSAACLSLFTLFLPEREGVRRAALTAFSLVLLLMLIPKGDVVLPDLFPSLDESETVSGEAYEETVKAQTLAAIKKDLCARFSIKEGELTLKGSFTLDGDTFTVDRLDVTLSGGGFFADVTSLLQYIEENYKADCEVHFIGA